MGCICDSGPLGRLQKTFYIADSTTYWFAERLVYRHQENVQFLLQIAKGNKRQIFHTFATFDKKATRKVEIGSKSQLLFLFFPFASAIKVAKSSKK